MAMTRIDRKAALIQARVRMTDLAKQLGVHVSHVSHVVNDRRRSPRVEQAIADAIGKPVARVFPQGAA